MLENKIIFGLLLVFPWMLSDPAARALEYRFLSIPASTLIPITDGTIWGGMGFLVTDPTSANYVLPYGHSFAG